MADSQARRNRPLFGQMPLVLVLPLLTAAMGRYLPANRVQAGSLRLADMTVRANDGRDLGKLVGFVVDAGAHRIRSLVVESGSGQLEVPMGHMQLDPLGQSLKLVEGGNATAFAADACPPVDDADLWVPVFHSAA